MDCLKQIIADLAQRLLICAFFFNCGLLDLLDLALDLCRYRLEKLRLILGELFGGGKIGFVNIRLCILIEAIKLIGGVCADNVLLRLGYEGILIGSGGKLLGKLFGGCLIGLIR